MRRVLGLKLAFAIVTRGSAPFTAFVCLELALLSACGSREPKPPASAPAPVVVKTVRAELQTVQDQLTIPAHVQADPARVVRIYPPVGGRLVRVSVRPGDRVRKGEPVAVLESAEIAQARADYAKARAEADRASHAFERAQLLYDHKVLSQREYEDADANYQEARSELERASERLHVLGAPLQGSSRNQVALVAPRDGVVTDLGAAPGELSKSTDNSTPICTIADLSQVWVVGDVYEKDLPLLRRGEPVEVTVAAFPDRHWSSKLAAVSDTLDAQTRTLKARVVLSNDRHELKPEMFATIRVARPLHNSIVLPASAVLREGGDTAVIVQTGPGQYERRLVHLSSANDSNVVIASGLKPGEVVVAEGAALLRGGGQP